VFFHSAEYVERRSRGDVYGGGDVGAGAVRQRDRHVHHRGRHWRRHDRRQRRVQHLGGGRVLRNRRRHGRASGLVAADQGLRRLRPHRRPPHPHHPRRAHRVVRGSRPRPPLLPLYCWYVTSFFLFYVAEVL